jgi:hypothetical protein
MERSRKNYRGLLLGYVFQIFVKTIFKAFFKDFFHHWVFPRVGAEIPFEKSLVSLRAENYFLPNKNRAYFWIQTKCHSFYISCFKL